MWLDDWSEKSMHVVVQRQLTDVSDSTKNDLPQLLTSFHKSQLMHGASPRDFVTLLQTCKAIYKVVTNVMEGIFFQVEQIHRKLCFFPKPMGAELDSSKRGSGDGPVPRSCRPHDTSFYKVYLTQALASAQSSRKWS